MHAQTAEDEEDYKQDEEDGEQKSRDDGEAVSEPRKAKKPEYQGTDGTDEGPIKHSYLDW